MSGDEQKGTEAESVTQNETPERHEPRKAVDGRPSTDDRAPESDADEETWTNQPKQAGSSAEDLDDEDELLGDDDDGDDFEEELPPAPRKPIQNGRDVLCEELPARASRAKMRLHSYLKAALVVELANSGERFVFDWRGEEPKVSAYESKEPVVVNDSAATTGIDSFVSITEQNLMAIRSGDLNPQVAMLADKIKVRGKMSPAVYLFNLIAPRVRD